MLLNVGSGKKRSHLILKLYRSRQIAQVFALCVEIVRCTHIRWMPKLLWGVAIPSNQTLFQQKKSSPLFPPPSATRSKAGINGRIQGNNFQSFHKFLLIKTATARRPPHTLQSLYTTKQFQLYNWLKVQSKQFDAAGALNRTNVELIPSLQGRKL